MRPAMVGLLVLAGAATGAASAPLDSTARAASAAPPAAAGAMTVAPVGWIDLLRETETLRFTPDAARLPLAHAFVQFGSEVVRSGDSLLVRNRDYGIDYSRGVVFLLARPTGAVDAEVSYLFLPGPVRRSFRAAAIADRETALGDRPAAPGAPSLPAAGAAPLDRPATDPRAAPSVAPATLQLAGSKTVGVSFGRNREATLDQSLHVEAAGELGEGLRVNAVLADDDLPVTVDGSTEELGDLSKIFLEVQGPVVGGVLGDYRLVRSEGALVHVQRELRGGEGRLRLGGQSLAIGAGIPKGEFVTTRFRGTEGRQGPYELLSARRIEFSTLVPGSERVYLDGEPMRRGENQDYIMDYDRGELRFTSRRRITADSEIAVDFQVNGAGYRRLLRDVHFDGGAGPVRVRGLVLEEGDDGDRPLTGAYDAQDLAALEGAGDAPVIAPGVRVVGPGRGLYRYASVDTTVVVYDPLGGDLEVSFYEVGSRQGAYEDSLDVVSGRRAFRHVGEGRGSFAIGHKLTPPGWHRLASAQVVATPWNATRFTGEFAVADFDANRFSTLDDDDNAGGAFDLRFQAGPPVVAGRSGTGGEVHFEQRSARFRPPDRARPPYYYKDWNAEEDSLRDTERLAEGILSLARGGERPWVRGTALVGRLDWGEDLRTDRAQLDLALGRTPERGVDLRVQGLDTERPVLGPDAGRTRAFWRTGARYRLGRLLPAVHVESDRFVRAAADSLVRPSYRYFEVGTRLGLLELRRTTASVGFERRDTDAGRSPAEQAAGLGAWAPDRRNDTVAFHLLTRPTEAWRAELELSRRTNVPRGMDAGPSTRSDLARSLVGWNPRARSARAELRYELSTEDVRTLEQVFVLAADGRGDYDAEGRPVGKDLGAYDKVVRYTGATSPVRQVDAALRLELGGAAGWSVARPDSGAGWIRRNVGLVQILAVREQTRSTRGRDVAFLVPSAFQNTSTVYGTFRARQEWSFLGASPRAALKLFLDLQNGLDGRLAGTSVRERERTATLRGERSDGRRWTLGGETGLASRRRSGQLDAIVLGRPSTGTFDVRTLRASGSLAYRVSPSERAALELLWTHQNDAPSATTQMLWTLAPTATLAPLRNLRLLATLAVTRVQESKPDDAVPPYFFDPPGTKNTASFLGSYRLGRNLDFTVNYTAVRNTDGRIGYDVKAETRAVF